MLVPHPPSGNPRGLLLVALALMFLLSARGVDAQSAVALAEESAVESRLAKAQLVRVEGDHQSPAAEEMDSLLAPYREKTAVLTEPVTTCTTTMSNRPPARELGAWMADVLRSAASEKLGEPVDVAIVNRGGIRATVSAGPVSRATMMQVMPFDNEIVVFRMTGEQLLESVKFLATRRGYYLYSGMRMAIDREARELRDVEVGGVPIEPSRTYLFAATDYVASGGDNTQFPPEVYPYESLGLLHRDALVAEVVRLGEAGEPVEPPADYFRMYYADRLPPAGFIPANEEGDRNWRSDSPRPRSSGGSQQGGDGGTHGPEETNASPAIGGGEDQ